MYQTFFSKKQVICNPGVISLPVVKSDLHFQVLYGRTERYMAHAVLWFLSFGFSLVFASPMETSLCPLWWLLSTATTLNSGSCPCGRGGQTAVELANCEPQPAHCRQTVPRVFHVGLKPLVLFLPENLCYKVCSRKKVHHHDCQTAPCKHWTARVEVKLQKNKTPKPPRR